MHAFDIGAWVMKAIMSGHAWARADFLTTNSFYAANPGSTDTASRDRRISLCEITAFFWGVPPAAAACPCVTCLHNPYLQNA